MAALSPITDAVLAEIRAELSQALGTHRFSHTLGVERAAVAMGELCLPDDLPRLCLAALLHDITKEWTKEEHLSFLSENGISLTPSELASPPVLHAKSGAVFAKKRYPSFVDDQILSAIRNHTTGAPDMTLFDEIIFLSDLVEEGRSYPLSLEVRAFLQASLSANAELSTRRRVLADAMLLSLRGTISHLLEHECPIAEATLKTYNAFLLSS